MTFNGKEDHSIGLHEAAEFTANYRKNAGPNAILAGFFGEETLRKILNQDGCDGLRFYYGQDDQGIPKLIIVGADENENDMIDGIIAERAWPCPPNCGNKNVLNS